MHEPTTNIKPNTQNDQVKTEMSDHAKPGIKKNATSLIYQTKLTVGAPNDPFEKEADAVADNIMRMPEQSFLQKKFISCEKENDLQIKSASTPIIPLIQRIPSTPVTSNQPLTGSTSLQSQVRYRPTGFITRTEFDNYVHTNYGVADIHTGTQSEQELRITRHGVPAPTIPNWQSWDPGTISEDYTSIIDGIEKMISTLGAIPQINRIIFFQVVYEPDQTTGIGTPQPNIGASFGAGELVIYEAFSGSTHPATGISTVQGTPTGQRQRDSDIATTIIHELGHGIGEAGSNNSRQMFDQYNATVGWIGSPPILYDMGQPVVRAAIANGTSLPSQHIITPNRWADSMVSEQPMSSYAVAGGPGEDFAESVTAYVNTPSVLQQRSPLRFNFINTNISSWTPRMRRMIPGNIRPPKGDFPMPSGDTRMA